MTLSSIIPKITLKIKSILMPIKLITTSLISCYVELANSFDENLSRRYSEEAARIARSLQQNQEFVAKL